MQAFLLVCLGGAFGSGLRFVLQRGGVALLGARFPWGTLTVNVIGSAALAWVASRIPEDREGLRLLLGTGVLGGFTTYSAFNHEVLQLYGRGSAGLALLYVVGTVGLCLGAGALLLRWR